MNIRAFKACADLCASQTWQEANTTIPRDRVRPQWAPGRPGGPPCFWSPRGDPAGLVCLSSLDIYYVPGTVPGTRHEMTKRQTMSLPSGSFHSRGDAWVHVTNAKQASSCFLTPVSAVSHPHPPDGHPPLLAGSLETCVLCSRVSTRPLPDPSPAALP